MQTNKTRNKETNQPTNSKVTYIFISSFLIVVMCSFYDGEEEQKGGEGCWMIYSILFAHFFINSFVLFYQLILCTFFFLCAGHAIPASSVITSSPCRRPVSAVESTPRITNAYNHTIQRYQQTNIHTIFHTYNHTYIQIYIYIYIYMHWYYTHVIYTIPT